MTIPGFQEGEDGSFQTFGGRAGEVCLISVAFCQLKRIMEAAPAQGSEKYTSLLHN